MAIPASDWPKIRERMESGEKQAAIGKTYKLSAASVSQFKKRMEAIESAGAKPAASKPRLVPMEPAVEKKEPPTNQVVEVKDFRDILLMLASCIVTVTEAANGRQNRTALQSAMNDLLYLTARLRVTADAA